VDDLIFLLCYNSPFRSENKALNEEFEMPELNAKGMKIELNEEGFLVDPEAWNKEIAEILGKEEEGIKDLSEDHWKVIDYIRGYYLEKNLAPMVRKVCKNTGFSLRYIFELFPSGPAKGACKVAGLPKPDGCV
jgi:tRNA 2-thiouridine synthesizing protein E